jgi:hypothetical protein
MADDSLRGAVKMVEGETTHIMGGGFRNPVARRPAEPVDASQDVGVLSVQRQPHQSNGKAGGGRERVHLIKGEGVIVILIVRVIDIESGAFLFDSDE